MGYSMVDAPEFEARRKPIARQLGAKAIRMNEFDNEPDQAGKEHDERESGQEEIYVPLRGRGILRVDGEEVPLAPGHYVLVSPDATRQVVAGPEGLGYLVVGAEL